MRWNSSEPFSDARPSICYDVHCCSSSSSDCYVSDVQTLAITVWTYSPGVYLCVRQQMHYTVLDCLLPSPRQWLQTHHQQKSLANRDFSIGTTFYGWKESLTVGLHCITSQDGWKKHTNLCSSYWEHHECYWLKGPCAQLLKLHRDTTTNCLILLSLSTLPLSLSLLSPFYSFSFILYIRMRV